MRLIDADTLVAAYDTAHDGPPGKARALILNAPTVDAVPVVRCKDCKWYCQRTGCCNRNAGIWTDDDFCSYAEWRGYNATD